MKAKMPSGSEIPVQWGEGLLSQPSSPISHPLLPLPGPSDERQERRMDRQWQVWEARLQVDILLATSLYAAAHVVLAFYRMSHDTPTVTPLLLAGMILFLIGTWPLWKVLRSLNEPVAARYPNAARTPGNCLLMVMGLAFTPCLWIFLMWT
jgi:hypothetical protein